MDKKIPVHDFREQLRLRASPVEGMNIMKTGEESIPAELATMEREKREKKLLEYQTKIKKGNVNQFLQSKYANGAFNEAIYEGYDNSKQRLENGITFDYHIYFDRIEKGDGSDKYAGQRPAAEYLLTDPIISPYGDRYFYHIPVHYTNSDKTEIATDIDDEIVNNNSRSISEDGLVYALALYKNNIKIGRNQFDNKSYNTLRKHGFIKEGKFTGSIPEKMVEKYLLNINEKERHNAIIYLNREFKKEEKEASEVEEAPKVDEEAKEDEEEHAPEPKAEEPASEPVPVPQVEEPRAEEPKEDKKIINNQKFRSAVESIRDEAIKSIEKVRNIKTTKFKFENELKDIYDKTIKEIVLSVRKTAAAEVNENFDSKKLKDKLEPFKLKAEETSKVYQDELEKENKKLEEMRDQIIDENSAPPSSWSEIGLLENYPKWKQKFDKHEDELDDIFLQKIENHSVGGFENLEEAIKKSINKYLKEMNESAEKLDKLNTKIGHWEDMLDEINDLLKRDPEAKIGSAKTAVEKAVQALDIPIQNLDFDSAEKKFNQIKHNKDAFNKHRDSLIKQKELSDKRLAKAKTETKASKRKAAKEASEKAEETAKEAAREQSKASKAADEAKKLEKEIEAEKDDLDDEEEKDLERKPVKRYTRSSQR